jgi:PAS domain S-box-containing protein
MGDELPESELTAEQYRALIAHTSDVVTVVDEEGTVRYQSPSSERVTGWRPEELRGENILEYVHSEDRDRVAERFGTLAGEADHIDGEVEFRFETSGGEWTWLAVTGTVADPEGPLEGYIITGREISERVRSTERLEEQRDGLRLLNEVVRHDIRNDLQVISAYAELLTDQVDGEGREYVETLRERVDHAVDLTRTARDMADVMLSADSQRQPVDLRATLERELDEVRSTYPGAAVTVDGTVPSVTVLADDMLDSILRNLLKNAIQHNDEDVPEVTVSVEAGGESVVVRVADNGPGVPDDRKEEVFGKGEKGLESGGAGLGLYLVRTLVDSYGGEVWVEDAGGENRETGAAFVLELPVADADDSGRSRG